MKFRGKNNWTIIGLVAVLLVMAWVIPVTAAPIADFTGTPRSGIVPLLVAFSDNSSPMGELTYAWEFGDGGTSTAQNPSNQYTSAGTFNVTLTVTDKSEPPNSNTKTETGYITVEPTPVAPTALFSTNVTSGTAPLIVGFTDASTGTAPLSYAWDFTNDGVNDSALQNPIYTYSAAGSFTARLTVTNTVGSDIVTHVITVNSTPVAPTAIFSTNVTSGTAPLTVGFTDASTGTAPLSYAWDFTNDGITDSTLQNPIYTYSTAGSFTANLTVTNTVARNFVTHIITVNAAPVPAFSGTPTSGPKPLNVQFTDASTGTAPLSYAWNFGDGNTSTLRNPAHLYTTAGSYTVNLTVTGPGGSNLESRTNYITVTNATTKIGIYKDGIWYLDLNGNGGKSASSDKAYSFGAPGWINVTGDWNNDGKTDIGVTNGVQWYLDMNNNGAWDASIDKAYSFGAPGWTPIVGDWNATGFSYIGVTNGQQWYLDWNGNGAWDSGTDVAYTFGAPGWTPIVGDWSATGFTYIGVTNGQQWYLDWNGNGAWDGVDKAYSFGAPGWTPVVGRWS